MTHEPIVYDKAKVCETISVLALFFLILGLIFSSKFLYVALAFHLIYLLWYGLALRITKVWLGFSLILGGFVSRILLSLTFFLFLTPISFLFRLFNPDELQLKKKEGSYFFDRDIQFDRGYFEKIW